MVEDEKVNYDTEELLEKDFTPKSSNKKRIIIIILYIFLIIFAVFCVLMTPTIKLKGKEEIKINYKEKYKDPGYVAKIVTKDVSKKVKIKGKVNTKKLGTYELEYTIKNFIFTEKITRTVKVVDEEKPVITLKGSEEANVCPKKEYIEEGYEAKDNHDGKLTDKVTVKKEKEKWTYEVKDSSKNKDKKVRKITYSDKENPTIELSGSSPMYIITGNTYTEPGYKANDNCDGDLTEKVKVEGNVNINSAGTYTLTYTVEDESGNKAEAKRTVTVQNRSYVSTGSGCNKAGAIYLTFDDGPQNGTTSKILDVLKNQGVKATFFVTNFGPDSLILREFQEGHTVALHTATHDYARLYASVDAYFNDLNSVSSRVKRVTGKDSKIIRFPGGSSNTISRRYSKGIMSVLTSEVIARGYRYHDWNVDSEDAGACASKNPTASCVYNNVVNHLSKSRCNMVLMHDVKWYTANAINDIITYGKNNGYTFEAIDMNTPMVAQRVNN